MALRLKILLFSAACLVSVAYGCRNKTAERQVAVEDLSVDSGAKITFEKYLHDFGNVREGEKLKCSFSFLNEGTGDLIINSATASCGCTVPNYSRKPVAPGASGSVDISFDTSGRTGKQTKTIVVNSNASKPVVLLQITAEIMQ